MPRNFIFYISRLRIATPRELLSRSREAVLVARLERQMRKSRILVRVLLLEHADFDTLSLPSFHSEVTDEVLMKVLSGELFVLNTEPSAVYESEKRCKGVFFSKVANSFLECDIRAAWESARLQHVSVLFIHESTAVSTGKKELKEFIRETVLRWIEEHPFLLGPHYISVMECGLRIPVFFYCLKCVDYLSLDERTKLLKTIFHHAWWIEKRLSLYSSLGNHTVCECMGLVFAGAVFRKTEEGTKWLHRGLDLLRKELDHQVLPDGGPAEQSLNYHRFVLDVYWLAVDFIEKNNLADCSDLKPRLVRGEEFLAAFIDENGGMPAIGDSDDGHAVAPGIAPLRGAVTAEKKKLHHFPDAGYSVIRLVNKTRVTFDHGPLGMAPLYNHGHADALSITVTKNGEQILVDPGTYRYNGVPEWRKYFKGTRAHNTVNIDGFDQAVQETGFIWSKPFATELVRSEETERGILLEAVNDGYARLKQPVKHRRTILVAGSACLLIKDSFFGKGSHNYELNFHLHPDVVAEERDGWWHLQKGKSRIIMTLLGDNKFISAQGQEAPILGWYSPAYGIKQKSTVLQFRKNGFPEDVSFLTAICLDDQIPLGELEQLAKSL